MANPVAVCVFITAVLLILSQVFLEYYVQITALSSDSYFRKQQPKLLATNKIYQEEINRYLVNMDLKT